MKVFQEAFLNEENVIYNLRCKMPKKVLASSATSNELDDAPDEEVFRVEDSIEDFIDLRMPNVANAKLDIRFLFASRRGSKFFRVNYWSKMEQGLVVTGRIIKSCYVRVDFKGKEKILVDLTAG
jgi:hypothetical protein